MGIEPTTRVQRVTGFEDQGSHQAPFTSSIRSSLTLLAQAPIVAVADSYPCSIEVLHQRYYVLAR